ncbi:DUF1707 SHOCT-like domain-containing protein [Corynebacterium sp. H130]|uniref:DUF1707 SHOCT-like domain-containing protein n=1 Tax=Corynebacterium sp. H130 TaxID=3133444 RepID=UPI00309725AA
MNPPQIRATDNERNQVIAVLSQALTNGQLDFAEYDERSKAVMQAKYRDELLAPLHDLVHEPAKVISSDIVRRPDADIATSAQTISPSTAGDSFSFSLMGGSEKKGAWTIAPSHTSITLMGGNTIDLTKATFAGRDVTIHAWAVMGGIDIIVPEDVRIRCDGVAVMGGFEVTDDREVTIVLNDLPENSPTLRVTGLALMGGVTIKRVRR